jgi:hypothetical protein
MLNFGLIPEATATMSGATRLIPGLFLKERMKYLCHKPHKHISLKLKGIFI